MCRGLRILLALLLGLSLIALAACGDDDDDNDAISDDDDDDDDDDNDTISDDDDNDDNDDDDNDDNDDDDDNDDTPGPYFSDFDRYWRTMDEGYAYFIEKDVDWDALRDEFWDRAFFTADLAEFQLVIAEMTARLRDTHTWSSFAGPYRQPTGVCLARLGEHVYVSRLSAEAAAEGMELGDRVQVLDDAPVDDVLVEALRWEGCSTPQCCDAYQLARVEAYAAGEDEVVYGVWRGSESLEFALDRTGSWQTPCPAAPLVDFLADAEGDILHYKPIGDDLGYLHLETLSDSGRDIILADLDKALTAFAGRDGLVFDARYNRGGSDLVAMAVLARFLDRLVVPVRVRYKNGPAHDDFTPWVPEPVLPGLSPWDVPVVFLINGGCVSAADFFAAAAAFVPTFTLLGTTTCGATGAPKSDTLPESNILYYYSQMQRQLLSTGNQVEGHGVGPDVQVEWDPADLANGVDTQLEAAIALLRSLRTGQ